VPATNGALAQHGAGAMNRVRAPEPRRVDDLAETQPIDPVHLNGKKSKGAPVGAPPTAMP